MKTITNMMRVVLASPKKLTRNDNNTEKRWQMPFMLSIGNINSKMQTLWRVVLVLK